MFDAAPSNPFPQSMRGLQGHWRPRHARNVALPALPACFDRSCRLELLVCRLWRATSPTKTVWRWRRPAPATAGMPRMPTIRKQRAKKTRPASCACADAL